MVDARSLPGETQEGSATPLFFGDAATTCFGFYHRARATPRSTGVVLCLPVGYEGTCSFAAFTTLAEQLASAGFDVLRFDYHGTGDSPGGDADPARVAAWRASIAAAVSELSRLSRARSMVLVGLRSGATLAADVVAKDLLDLPIDSMVLWAPYMNGRAFARELKMAAATRLGDEEASADSLEALGFLYTAETLHDLAAIDLLATTEAPAKHVLLLGRDATAVEGRLGAHLRAQTDLSFLAEDGLTKLLTDSPQRVVPEGLLERITDWLKHRHPVVAIRNTSPPPPPALDCAVFEGVRETPLRFGEDDSLFGILTQPEHVAIPHGQRARTAILMLNVGTNHRVGPNRLYVKMARHWARAGYHTLRFDLAGMGDSRTASGYTETRLYSKDSVHDVRAAIDALSARGCDRFVLLGLCSGAYAAFQATLADPRVVAQVLLNPRRLSLATGDTLERVMSESYKSRRYYQKAMLAPQTYIRLWRGEVNIRGIGRRMQALIGARLVRFSARLLGRAADEDVLTNVRQLCRRGVESLFVVASEDDGVDYLEFHLGTAGKAVRSPRFRMHFVHGSDHTFSRIASQDELIAYVSTELTKRLPGCRTRGLGPPETARLVP